MTNIIGKSKDTEMSILHAWTTASIRVHHDSKQARPIDIQKVGNRKKKWKKPFPEQQQKL